MTRIKMSEELLMRLQSIAIIAVEAQSSKSADDLFDAISDIRSDLDAASKLAADENDE